MPYFLILYLNNLQLHSWIIPHFFNGKDILVSVTFYIRFYKILIFFKLIFQVLIFYFEKYNIALEYAKIWRRRHIKHRESAYNKFSRSIKWNDEQPKKKKTNSS